MLVYVDDSSLELVLTRRSVVGSTERAPASGYRLLAVVHADLMPSLPGTGLRESQPSYPGRKPRLVGLWGVHGS
jgi:hypothetical protein